MIAKIGEKLQQDFQITENLITILCKRLNKETHRACGQK